MNTIEEIILPTKAFSIDKLQDFYYRENIKKTFLKQFNILIDIILKQVKDNIFIIIIENMKIIKQRQHLNFVRQMSSEKKYYTKLIQTKQLLMKLE